jgi:Kef-type K+ transport system membrane component KefB
MITVELFIIGFWLICALVTAAIWMIGNLFFAWVYRRHGRFSLRALFIVTTIIAVTLGFAAYAARK